MMNDIDKNLNIIEKETNQINNSPSKAKDDEDLDSSFINQGKRYRNKLSEYGYKISVISHPFNLFRIAIAIVIVFLCARYIAPLCPTSLNKILKLIEDDSKFVLSYFVTIILTNVVTKYIETHHK